MDDEASGVALVANEAAAHAELAALASWSDWVPFDEALHTAPRLPGVYLAREGTSGPYVYVGMAGERRGSNNRPQGLRGRLGVYAGGKALTSGLGEAVADRAFADPAWLADRLAEAERGEPMRASQWGKATFERAGLWIRWAVTADRSSALALERECIFLLSEFGLWNRGSVARPKFIEPAVDEVSGDPRAAHSPERHPSPMTGAIAAPPEDVSDLIQTKLRQLGRDSVGAVEAAQWLDAARLLADSTSRPGLPLRNLLRSGSMRGARQEGRRWIIDRLP